MECLLAQLRPSNLFSHNQRKACMGPELKVGGGGQDIATLGGTLGVPPKTTSERLLSITFDASLVVRFSHILQATPRSTT